MNRQTIHGLIDDAVHYPLAMRIAAKLHLAGVTEAVYQQGDFGRLMPTPLVMDIQNHLRNFERGAEINSALKQLAEQLTLPKSRPPHPLDLSYWTLEKLPRFEPDAFMADVNTYIEHNHPWKR